MSKVMSIIGTRPEAIRVFNDLDDHLIVNTGQHYDSGMDEIFWRERGFNPDINLGARTFSEIYDKISQLVEKEKPQLVITYGDTRSDLASALATTDNDIALAHLEAGVRCGDMEMPEERYRIMIDSISDYLFAINEHCKENLIKENVSGEIFIVGDIMFDEYLAKRKPKDYILMTIHRKQNQNSKFINELINEYKNELKIIFPVHPVMKKFLKEDLPSNLEIIEPTNHRQMLDLIKDAKLVVTDSGGVQREAFFMGVPLDVRLRKNLWKHEISVFGDGSAKEKIKKIINEKISS